MGRASKNSCAKKHVNPFGTRVKSLYQVTPMLLYLDFKFCQSSSFSDSGFSGSEPHSFCACNLRKCGLASTKCKDNELVLKFENFENTLRISLAIVPLPGPHSTICNGFGLPILIHWSIHHIAKSSPKTW